jgi:hypothetical protein
MELKPCPFCGGPAGCDSGDGEPAASAWCHRADENLCENISVYSIGAWNNRPIEDALSAEIADLKAKLAVVKAEVGKGWRWCDWGAIERAVSGVEVLAVVDARVGVEGKTTMYHCVKVPVDLPFETPVRVVVMRSAGGDAKEGAIDE